MTTITNGSDFRSVWQQVRREDDVLVMQPLDAAKVWTVEPHETKELTPDNSVRHMPKAASPDTLHAMVADFVPVGLAAQRLGTTRDDVVNRIMGDVAQAIVDAAREATEKLGK